MIGHRTPYEYLKFHRSGLRNRDVSSIFGFDTETYTTGYAFIICCGNGQSSGLITSFDDCLSFLCQHKFRQSHAFFYNLRFDVQAIMKWAGEKLCAELWDKQKIKYKDYTIEYLRNKMFKIKKNKNLVVFTDLASFYLGSLDSNAQKYLGRKKAYIETYEFTKPYVKKHFSEIEKYCIQDSIDCQELAELLISKVETKDIHPPYYISKASISEAAVIHNLNLDIDLQTEHACYAYESYSGGWFELFEKGYQNECYEYDINSAYPYAMANYLIDYTKGKWVSSKRFKNAPRGFIKCRIDVPYMRIAPIPIYEKTRLIHPIGEIEERILPIDEYKEYSKYCDIEIIKGWYFFPDSMENPLKDFVNYYYSLRQETQDPMDNYLYKIILNSLYGKFWQVINNKIGKLFYPYWASEITSQCRLAIWKAIQKAGQDNIISIATDSIISKKPIQEYTKTKELGKFNDESGKCEGVFIASGLYQLKGQDLHKAKHRGIKLQLDWLTALQTEKQFIETSHVNVISLGSVLRQKNVYNWEQLNTFLENHREVNINSDIKRIWNDDFSSGFDALSRSIDSEPVCIM